MSDALRGEAVPPSFSTSLGVAIPLAASILLAAALAVVHRFVVEPPEDSKRKRVPKRRHIIMAPTSWTDRRTLYSTPRAFECWLKMSRTSHGGVLIGSLGPWTTRAINVEVREGRPRIVWRARDFAYEWTVETDVRTEEWVHLVITFATNSALDMLLCFIDGAEVEDARPETALPTVVPELAMLVGRDHTDDPDQVRGGPTRGITRDAPLHHFACTRTCTLAHASRRRGHRTELLRICATGVRWRNCARAAVVVRATRRGDRVARSRHQSHLPGAVGGRAERRCAGTRGTVRRPAWDGA